jgi:hypothetical protein
MATDPELVKQTADIYAQLKSQRNTAKHMGISRSTVQNRLQIFREQRLQPNATPEVLHPDIPDPHLPVEELLDQAEARYKQLAKHAEAVKWFNITLTINGPVGVSFFGDPHIDDAGCDLTTLRHHCELHKKTEGLYAINDGDTTNNWVGRLGRLFAEQDASQDTARRFAYWLMSDSGVTWIAWILGNHDLWNEGKEIMERMNAQRIALRHEKFPGMQVSEWQARFNLVFPNGRKCPIWMSHDFPGHSMYNPLHGPLKAAMMRDRAAIYACGHKHNWGMFNLELPGTEHTFWLIRSKGYKRLDQHASKMGHDDQQSGASITAIIDPEASENNMVQCFHDMDLAADFLNFQRRKFNRSQ